MTWLKANSLIENVFKDMDTLVVRMDYVDTSKGGRHYAVITENELMKIEKEVLAAIMSNGHVAPDTLTNSELARHMSFNDPSAVMLRSTGGADDNVALYVDVDSAAYEDFIVMQSCLGLDIRVVNEDLDLIEDKKLVSPAVHVFTKTYAPLAALERIDQIPGPQVSHDMDFDPDWNNDRTTKFDMQF